MLVAGVLGAFVVFVAQSLSWLVLGVHARTLHTLPNGDAIGALLRESNAPAGIYHHPGLPQPGERADAYAERWRRGPVMPLLAYHPEGVEPFTPAQPLRGWLLDVLNATIVAYLLSLAAPSLPGYLGRVVFVVLVGAFAASSTYLAMWNWMAIPLPWTLTMAAELIVSWTLVGLVLAWRLAPEPAAPAGGSMRGSRRSAGSA